MSCSADKCRAFFKLIKNHKGKINWNDKCSIALSKIKEDLTNLPTLQTPMKNKTLFLYVASSTTAVSSVLVVERGKCQKPVFYFSKTFQCEESSYPSLENLAFAVIISARRLKSYFQAHTIIIPTKYPLLKTFHKPNILDRTTKWALELSEYNITFVPSKVIKSQILADFMIELSPNNQIKNDKSWKLFIDGSSAKDKCGAGVVLIDPDNIKLEYTIKLSFQITNNIVEYEAFL